MSSAPTPEGAGHDHEKFLRRLNALPREDLIAFAIRCALRVLPFAAPPNGLFPREWQWSHAAAHWAALRSAIRYAFAESSKFERGYDSAASESLQFVGWELGAAAEIASVPVSQAVASAAAQAAMSVVVHGDELQEAAWLSCRTAHAAIMQYDISRERGVRFVHQFDATIEFDLRSFEQSKPVLPSIALITAFSVPFWPEWLKGVAPLWDRQVDLWTTALQSAARSHAQIPAGDDVLSLENVDEILRQFRSVERGTPDWDAILGSELWSHVRASVHSATQPKASQTRAKSEPPSPVRFDWPPLDSARLLARLAYADPSLMASAERPALDSVSTALNARGFKTADPKQILAALASEADDLEPDPLWLAWVRAAHPQFFSDLASWQPKPPDKPAAFDAGEVLRRVAAQTFGVKKSGASKSTRRSRDPGGDQDRARGPARGHDSADQPPPPLA